MDLKLADKTALVTGSSLGTGFAIAKSLATEGANVYLNSRSQEKVDQAIAKIKAELPKANLKGIAADLGTAQGLAKLVKELPEVDILINNVGIFEPKAFEDITDEVASLVTHLCSPLASATTGSSMRVDGGRRLRHSGPFF